MASLKCPERPGGDTPPRKKGKCKQPGGCVCVVCQTAFERWWCSWMCVAWWSPTPGMFADKCRSIFCFNWSPQKHCFLLSVCQSLHIGHYRIWQMQWNAWSCWQKVGKDWVSLSNKFIHLKDELSSMAAKIGSSVEKLKSSIVKSKFQWTKCGETMIATLDNWLNN